MRSLSAIVVSTLVLFSGLCVLAQGEHHHTGAGPEQLGKVSFPTSCSPAVQKPFERAVALLHSFQYEWSEKAFSDVARKDPHCAMAHWGVAMSLYHPIWEKPDAGTLKKGWAAVEKADPLNAGTARERDYIAALATFYRDPEKLDNETRAAAYARAMEQLCQRYPEDREAAAFYALSLLGSEPPRDATFANRKRAIAVLEALFKERPDHPGVAHYLIHASDTPQLAPLGLNAARRYAKIAPSSPHALHMPSHIFTRLGLWTESIDSNLASSAAAEKATAKQGGGAPYQLHAMDFLQYAYLQSGQDVEARRLVDKVKNVPGATTEETASSLVQLQARYAIELHQWREAAVIEPIPTSRPGARAVAYWARCIGAARSSDATGARDNLAKLEALGKQYGAELYVSEREEAAAWLADVEGRKDEAVKMMRAAAEREDAAGPDSLAVPAREMLADMLLELRQPVQALREYEIVLRESPNRFNGLYGAARAAGLAGDRLKAKGYYTKLEQVCAHAQSQRPELQEARLFLARTPIAAPDR